MLIIIISCYLYYITYRRKQKHLLPFNSTITKLSEIRYLKYIVKMESKDELKEFNIKNRTCYYFDDIDKFKYFNVGNFN